MRASSLERPSPSPSVLLGERLQARRDEIEQATLARISAIAGAVEITDPIYTDGLRAALSIALDYGLAIVECREERSPPIPPALLVQARLAARGGVGLDTVLRRYFAGYALLSDFLVEEAEASELFTTAELKRLLRTQATLFDRLLSAVSEEYRREAQSRPSSTEQRRAERVKRLLDGEMLDTVELGYHLGDWHLGVVATGPGASQALRGLAVSLDRRLLLVHPDQLTAWAWFGGRQRLDIGELHSQLSSSWPGQAILSVGEPAEGIAGWRHTHFQAAAAVLVAQRRSEPVTRYADVALLVSVLKDDLLVGSLEQLYLAPLRSESDGGKAAKKTLRAYFAAGHNVSSAAMALGVNRRTVTSRLRAIEELFGRSLDRSVAEIDTALQLDELGNSRAVAQPGKGPSQVGKALGPFE